jgi:hypothetical protein
MASKINSKFRIPFHGMERALHHLTLLSFTDLQKAVSLGAKVVNWRMTDAGVLLVSFYDGRSPNELVPFNAEMLQVYMRDSKDIREYLRQAKKQPAVVPGHPKIGEVVRWRGTGKCARAFGYDNKILSGKVFEIPENLDQNDPYITINWDKASKKRFPLAIHRSLVPISSLIR